MLRVVQGKGGHPKQVNFHKEHRHYADCCGTSYQGERTNERHQSCWCFDEEERVFLLDAPPSSTMCD